MQTFWIKIISFGLFFCVHSLHAGAQSVEPELSRKLNEYVQEQQLLLNGKANIHVLVERDVDGGPVYSLNDDQYVHMASVQKILITYAALKLLGASHTFPTEIYSNWRTQDQSNSLDVGIAEGKGYGNKEVPDMTLYVRPYGDPLFQFEDALKIARALKVRGYTNVNKLVIDKSLFYDPEEVKGRGSYVAAQTATSIEFNSFRVEVLPSSSGMPAQYDVSRGFYGEVLQRVKTLRTKGSTIEVSMSPDFNTFTGRGFPPKGPWRPTKFKLLLDGKMGLEDPEYVEYIAHPEPDSFYANSIKQALIANGISVSDQIEYGLVPDSARQVYEHQSRPLSDVVKSLNHFSNNFIAGQLLYAIGQDKDGLFKRDVGYQNLIEALSEIPNFIDQENKSKFILKDASGLSKDNRISPRQVTKVLRAASRNISIYPTLMAALPRMGHDGTLEQRALLGNKDEYNVRTSFFVDLEERANGVWAKSGTVDKVSSLAGFAEPQSHQRLVFSITIIGDIKKIDASKIEDGIIKILLGISDKK